MHAHTDDMECASGGLVAHLKGIAEVYAVIMTNGDKGCSNDAVCGNSTKEEIAVMRQAEQLNSAAVLGIPAENVVFLPYEDCQLNSYPEQNVERELVSLVRKIQPHIVFTWDPAPRLELIPSEGWGDLGYHPDHQTSGKRTLDAVSSQTTKQPTAYTVTGILTALSLFPCYLGAGLDVSTRAPVARARRRLEGRGALLLELHSRPHSGLLRGHHAVRDFRHQVGLLPANALPVLRTLGDLRDAGDARPQRGAQRGAAARLAG
jgi:LmbE family N-acetylglucosaminyl deacetylase